MRFLPFLLVFLLLLVPTVSALDNFTDEPGTHYITGGSSYGKTYHEYLQMGIGTKLKYNGNITNVVVAVPSNANATAVTSFKVKIWRYNGTTFTCVASTEELESQVTTGLNNISLATELEVKAGDYYGFCISNSDTTTFYFEDATSKQQIYYAGAEVFNVSDSYNFVTSGTLINKVHRIDLLGYRNSTHYPCLGSEAQVLGHEIVPMNEPITFNISVPSGTTNTSISLDGSVEDYKSSPSSTEELEINITSFGEHNISIYHSATDVYENMTVYAVEGAQSAPYSGYHHDSGTSTGVNTWYFQDGHTTRIRQNGNISAIGLYAKNTSSLMNFTLMIWREDGAYFDKLGQSANLASLITVDGFNLVELPTPMAVQEADYYGLKAQNPNGTFWRNTDDAGTSLKYYSASEPSADNFDWDSCSGVTNCTFRIDLYMDECPDIVLIGDSHISGYGELGSHVSFADDVGTWTNVPHQIGYQLSNLTNYTYQNMGICGERSDEIRERFTTDALYANPCYVLVEGGFNDYKINRGQNETIDDLSWMIDTSQDWGIDPIAFEILGTNDYSRGGDYDNMLERDYINSYLESTYRSSIPVVHGRNYVGIYDSNGTTGNLWGIHSDYVSADGYHYNIAGYTRLAQAVKDEMDESLGANPSNMNYSIAAGGFAAVTFIVASWWNRRRSR